MHHLAAAPGFDWVAGAIWLYIAASLGLLLLVRQLQWHALYLLKGAWVGFTVLAFAWVVMMSGATNAEFAHRPGGFFEQLGAYPRAFEQLFGLPLWWLPLLLWLPAWVAPALLRRRRRLLRGCLLGISALVLAPLVKLALDFDWSVYAHFVDNYRHALRVARMDDYLLNSVLVSLTAVGLVSLVGSMAAYALSRLRFAGRRIVLALIIGAMAVPGALLMVPLFLSLKGWATEAFSFSNSRLGLSVIYAAISLPFTTFLLQAFYASLPGELARAAVVDGASPWRVFTDVYFPLSGPALATTAIFNFLAVWNEYHFALIFLTNADFRTLPVGLYNLHVSQQYAVNWPAMFAGVVLLVLPTLAIFVALQERIVAGLTVGSLKA
jgi:N-acetylglucosamine transport system permease protein